MEQLVAAHMEIADAHLAAHGVYAGVQLSEALVEP